MAEGEAFSPFARIAKINELICWGCWRWATKILLATSPRIRAKLQRIGQI